MPHIIELMQVGYDKLFSILRSEKEIKVLINPFINAYLNDAIASKIAALSSGEFVGMVADNLDDKIDLKSFHSAIQHVHDALKREQGAYKSIPQLKQIQATHVQQNYWQIKEDIENIIFQS